VDRVPSRHARAGSEPTSPLTCLTRSTAAASPLPWRCFVPTRRTRVDVIDDSSGNTRPATGHIGDRQALPWSPHPAPVVAVPTVPAGQLQPGDRIDLSELWTVEYDPALHAFASTEWAQVEAVAVQPDGSTRVYLFDAPTNAIIPAGVTVPVLRQ